MSLKRSSSISSEMNDFTEEDGKKVYQVSKSRLLSLIDWVTVFSRFAPIILYLLMAVLLVQISVVLYEHRFDFKAFYVNELSVIEVERTEVFGFSWKTLLLVILALWYLGSRERPVYLLDFATFEPPKEWLLNQKEILECLGREGCFSEDSLNFMDRMIKQSGTGPATAWPPAMAEAYRNNTQRDASSNSCRKEAELVIFPCVREVLAKTKTNPKDISILVINCSLFSPTPSLCSMVVNEFGLRADCSTYNLSGMGCSAGVISIELVKNLLAGRPNATALIVSTELISNSLYAGNDRAFLLQNILFRCGGAAMILSNRWKDALRAKFKLLHVVRTQYVSEDSFGCVYETQDDSPQRNQGVRLSKDIVKVAGRALEKNFTALGPHILPFGEQFKVAVSMIAKMGAKALGMKTKINMYIPDFKRAVDHFCIHAGGRAVIDGIEKNLSLTPRHVEASRYTLYTYGNTSSSSIWYELNYIRNHMELHSGQRVLQIAFGSGFKCNSAVWLCMNTHHKADKPTDKEHMEGFYAAQRQAEVEKREREARAETKEKEVKKEK